jgi:hypothetical protein
MINEHFVIIGALVSFIGAANYIWHTLQGRTKPNRVTWTLWTIAPMVAFVAQMQKGVGWPALVTFTSGFIPLLILIASFVNKQAGWRLSRFDVGCGALSVFGIILWLVTGEGNLAILFAIMADGLAGLPTVVKAYKYPETESWAVFLAGILNATITLFVLDRWHFADYAFATYLILMNSTIILLVRFKIGPRLRGTGRAV